MVTGWEKYTSPLTKVEYEVIVPYIVSRLKYNVGESKAVKAGTIIKALNDNRFTKESKRGKTIVIKITGPRFRQMIHFIRKNGLVKHLIANSKGYYVAETIKEVQQYITSLEERRNSFEEVRRAMQQELLLNPPKESK